MKRILSFFLTLVLTAALLCPAALAVNETAAKDRDWVYITLDPGHGGDGAGGNDSGAASSKRARTTVRPIPTASSPTITASSATASSGTSRP